MNRILLTVAVLLSLTLPPVAQAQMGMSAGPRFHSDFTPVVGGWSEYQVTPGGRAPAKMKVAVVGKEGAAYWYEMAMEVRGEGTLITKMLVSGNPEDPGNVKRIIIKSDREPAMEMPAQAMAQAPKNSDTPGKMIDKGMETVRVPAGTFQAKRFQYREGSSLIDVWIKKDISPYGLVKSSAKDYEMVLIGYGSGAKTRITEQPQAFEMPQLPPGFPGAK